MKTNAHDMHTIPRLWKVGKNHRKYRRRLSVKIINMINVIA